jgi:alanine racemase
MITAEVQICQNSFLHNVNILKGISEESEIVFVFKANAYGHGANELAKLLGDKAILAVARIEEALLLRKQQINNPILLLEGCFCQRDLLIAAKMGFQVVIHNYKQLKEYSSVKLPIPIRVWIKVNTGMNRLGIEPTEVRKYFTEINNSANLAGQVILCSHFSSADLTGNRVTLEQLDVFKDLVDEFQVQASIANSSAFLNLPETHFDFVRIGLAIYGISPISNSTCLDFCLKPVMRLKSQVISIKSLPRGSSVSYGGHWTTDKDTKIGVVALGYADGYPRNIPVDTPVWINGRIVTIVGAVCMDMIIINLGINSCDCIGDDVVFWGPELPIELVANHLRMIPYELVCNISPRVAITYIR